jgi:hypothetical protein
VLVVYPLRLLFELAEGRLIPHFGCSQEDTGDGTALQAVNKVARAALPIEKRGEPIFRAILSVKGNEARLVSSLTN